MTNKEVVERIKYYLLEKDISSYELSRIMGVKTSVLIDILDYKTEVSLERLQMITIGLGISMGEFFGEEKPLADITPREEELLKKYRKLSVRDRDMVHRTINVMSKEICYGKSIGNGISKKTV